MNVFLSTAFRYAKGQSGLPSLLPARGSADLAREKSRKVGLFCKGLEHFREILYKEPGDEDTASVATMQDLSSPGSTKPPNPDEIKQDRDSSGSTSSVAATVADKKSIAPTIEQSQASPSATTEVIDETEEQEPAASSGTPQDEELSSSTKAATETIADQKPSKYILTSGEELFQSLFAPEKTPPTSPGSVASSSTLVDPSSRKVSPSDLDIYAKDSPVAIAVKDFAYPSPDSEDVLDPAAKVDGSTKKELLKQPKKNAAAGEKVSRKLAKLKARNETLRAELNSANADVQNRDAQVDLAKTYANAAMLSSVVFRQAMQDMSHELTRLKHGSLLQEAHSQGEATWDQQKEESLQNHLQIVDRMGASARDCMARLEKASVKPGRGLDNVEDHDNVCEEMKSKESGSLSVDQKISEEVQVEAVISESSTKASEGTRLEPQAEEFKLRPQKAETFFEKYGFDPAELSRILNSVTPAVQKNHERDNEEVSHAKEALDEVKEDTKEANQDGEREIVSGSSNAEETANQVEANVEWIFPGLKPNESAIDKGQEIADPIATNLEDATPDQDWSSESSAESQVFEEEDDYSLSMVKDSVSGGHNEDPACPSSATWHKEHDQAVDSRGINVSYEFSEPAGPATMFGILRSEQRVDEAKDEADARREAAEDPGALEPTTDATSNDTQAVSSGHGGCINADYEFSEPAGPATMFGILRSEQHVDEAKDEADTGEEIAEDLAAQEPTKNANSNQDCVQGVSSSHGFSINANYEFSEPAGPATMFGILRSEQRKIEVEDHEGADDEAANIAEVQVPCPANLWGILKSNSASPGDDSSDGGPGEQAGANGGVGLGEAKSNGFAGVRDQEDKEPIDAAHVELSPSSKEDNEEDIVERPTATQASTSKEGPAPRFHAYIDSDDVTVQNVDTPGVNLEDAVQSIGADSPNDAIEAITEPIGDSKIVEIDDHTTENGAVEVAQTHETAVPVVLDAPNGTAEDMPEHSGHATIALPEDREKKQPAQKANASDASTVSGQLHGSCGKEAAGLAENDAINHAHPFPGAEAEKKEGPEEGRSEGSVISGKSKVICESCNESEDGELQNVAIGGSRTITGEGGEGKSGVARAPILTPPGSPPSPARAYSLPAYLLPEPEIFHFPGPVPQPKTMMTPEVFDFPDPFPQPKKKTKGQKRKESRKRVKAKERSEAAQMGVMMEEAANTPEALAQRQAEEDAKMGEKRLKLQAARYCDGR